MLAKDLQEAQRQEVEYFASIKSDSRIDLITVTYFRQNLTDLCLSYLLTRTRTPYRLTVVDNGSKDSTVQFLLKLKQQGFIDNLILLDRNWGLDRARGTALRHLTGEYAVFFDNDLLVPRLEPDWLSQEVDLLAKHPEFGAIALRPQIAVGVSSDIFKSQEEIIENNHCGATFLMFRTDTIKEIGWSDDFTNRVSDWRLGDLLKEKGLKMGWAKDLHCWHMFGKNWSYPEDVQHFHREIHPPSECYDDIKVDSITFTPND